MSLIKSNYLIEFLIFCYSGKFSDKKVLCVSNGL